MDEEIVPLGKAHGTRDSRGREQRAVRCQADAPDRELMGVPVPGRASAIQCERMKSIFRVIPAERLVFVINLVRVVTTEVELLENLVDFVIPIGPKLEPIHGVLMLK